MSCKVTLVEAENILIIVIIVIIVIVIIVSWKAALVNLTQPHCTQFCNAELSDGTL